jgi:protein tyrosine/serine phosphatase
MLSGFGCEGAKMKLFLSLLIVFGAHSSLAQTADETHTGVNDTIFATDLPNYMVVNPTLSRSGRPTMRGLQMAQSMGMKTIINLENEPPAIEREKKTAQQMGFQYFISEMDASQTPNDQEMKKLLTMLQDKSLQPILIHCFHGRDRTGLVVGLYRVFVDGWEPKKAYEEMLADGFDPKHRALDQYFKDKTRRFRP